MAEKKSKDKVATINWHELVENWCCIGRLMSQESIKYLFSKDNVRIISWHELVEGWYYFGRLMAEECKDNIRIIS